MRNRMVRGMLMLQKARDEEVILGKFCGWE